MTDLSLEPMLPQSAGAPEPNRQRVLLTTSVVVSAAIGMFFISLVGYYLQARGAALEAGESWLDESIIRLQPANMALGTLALSLVTVYWLVYSVRNNDRPNAYVALLISLALGGAVINAVAFVLADSGLSVRDSVIGMLVYALSGSFIVLMLAAMLYLVVVGFRLLGAQNPSGLTELATAAALFWLATTLVYSVIWYAVYITK